MRAWKTRATRPTEGATERSRRLTLEARSEFERAGYRLGIPHVDIPAAAPVDAATVYDLASLTKVLATTVFAVESVVAGRLQPVQVGLDDLRSLDRVQGLERVSEDGGRDQAPVPQAQQVFSLGRNVLGELQRAATATGHGL